MMRIAFILAFLLSGWVTEAQQTNNAAVALTVTNASTVSYPPIVGKWTYPGFQPAITTWTNHYMGFQKFARNNRPVALAYDVAQDAHGHIITNLGTIVKEATIGNSVVEYQSIQSATNFTQGDVITNTFYLVPWIGTNVFVSAPQYDFCDRSNTGVIVAVVSPTGNNSTGTAFPLASVASARALPCADVTGATAAINAYNNTHNGFYGASEGIVFVQAGSYGIKTSTDFGSPVAGTCWTTITPDSGYTRAQIIFTNTDSLLDVPSANFLKYEGVTFLQTTNYVMFNSASVRLWLDNCYIQSYGHATGNIGSVGFFNGALTVDMVQCVVSNGNSLQPFGNDILRGNKCDLTYQVIGNCIIGNSIVCATNSGAAFIEATTDGDVVAYNSFFGACGNVLAVDIELIKGLAVVQNVFERIINPFSGPILDIGSSTTSNMTNVIFVKNTSIGDRENWFYYGASGSTVFFEDITVQDNLLDSSSVKSDAFESNSNQIGNWVAVNGVGWKGNGIGSTPGNSFYNEFYGLRSIYLATAFGDQSWDFVNDQSEAGTGSGDYHVQTKSKSTRLAPAWNGLPWDLAGQERGTSDPPGAYVTANPRRSSGAAL